jgi:hypothetical protein
LIWISEVCVLPVRLSGYGDLFLGFIATAPILHSVLLVCTRLPRDALPLRPTKLATPRPILRPWMQLEEMLFALDRRRDLAILEHPG